jgi:hypothetical protein
LFKLFEYAAEVLEDIGARAPAAGFSVSSLTWGSSALIACMK